MSSVFITGAAQGIGFATAKHFAAKGWFVGLSDINAAQLEKARREIGEDKCAAYVLDVRDRPAWTKALSEFTAKAGGKLDVLINNAGLTCYDFFDSYTDDEIDRIVDVNLKGTMNGARAALPLLKASKGALVNIASCAAFYGSPKYSVYAATKAGVRALSEALDVEYSRFGIKVRCILPWSLETPILESHSSNSTTTIRDDILKSGQAVYPVEDAALMIEKALNEDGLHYIVGEAGEATAMAVRTAFDQVRAGSKAQWANQ